MQQSVASSRLAQAAGGACACPTNYNPVCCNGSTFMNGCSAACLGGVQDLGVCVAGACRAAAAPAAAPAPSQPRACRCAQLANPVCCSGADYANGCEAGCAGADPSTCRAGTCPPPSTDGGEEEEEEAEEEKEEPSGAQRLCQPAAADEGAGAGAGGLFAAAGCGAEPGDAVSAR